MKTNGEEMVGNVKSIEEESLSFIYKNETIVYKVKQSDIVKITFASGRVQFFNKINQPGNTNNISLENHHNKVAVLPFVYIKDNQEGDLVMSNKIQTETLALLNKHRGELTYLSVNDTNALLVKAGVTNNNIQGYTMGEICTILGVEYVIQGMVSVEKTTQQNINTFSETTKNKENTKAYIDSQGHLIGNPLNNGKSQSYGSSVSTYTQNYATSMTMNIFNDKGHNIYSQDHTSFWNTQDAYKITLKYLAKRMPLFKK
ncbi:hypothetical protein ACFQ5N_14085 [Lutibacter holmesii]|uniref:Uncharacterized protein n=1 Tax=Lutibacter holmesii TaxID=1137985 RepID=A0ABW3WRS9_9FLAO